MPYHFQPYKIHSARFIEFFFHLFSFFFRKFNNSTKGKILIIEPFQLGDVVSLSVMLEPLKVMFPKSEIYFLVKKGNEKIFANDRRVQRVFTTEFPWSDYGSKKGSLKRWFYLFKTIYLLRKYKFDIGIDTRGDIRSQVIMMLIRCKQKIGHISYLGSNILLKGLLLDTIITPPIDNLHRYDWNLLTLQAFKNVQSDYKTIKFPTFEVLDESRMLVEQYILLHIGGGWKYKRWSNNKWTELIGSIKRNYSFYKIVVMSGPAETLDLEYITEKINDKEILFFSTTFNQMINLINYCSLFVGLDSGPMNIAVCLNKKVVSLFGPGDSDMWYPYNQRENFIHKLEFPCIPCFQTTCFFAENSCMNRISVTEVLLKINTIV